VAAHRLGAHGSPGQHRGEPGTGRCPEGKCRCGPGRRLRRLHRQGIRGDRMMRNANLLQQTGAWLSERFPVEKLTYESLFQKKEVPVHHMSWGYYFGGLALFFFSIQLVTGLLLLFYYQPTVADAHASVEFIMRHVSGGALIRNVHTWSSSGMIF